MAPPATCVVRGETSTHSSTPPASPAGETSPDYKLTLEVVYCLGSCGISPVALVNEKVYGRLNADTLIQRVKALD